MVCDAESVLYLQKSLEVSSFYRWDRCFDYCDNAVEFHKAKIAVSTLTKLY